MKLIRKEGFWYCLLIVIIFVFALLFCSIIIPEIQSIKDQQTKLIKDKRKIELSEDWEMTTLKLDNEVKRLEIKIEKVVNSKKNYHHISDFISFIQLLANEQNLTMSSFTPLDNNDVSDIKSQRYSVELIGKYQKTIDWLSCMENSANNVIFNQVDIKGNIDTDDELHLTLILEIIDIK